MQGGSAGPPRLATSSSARVNSVAATPQMADSLFTCPITQEVMTDPVMAADGYT
jgi:hypothetical protein